MSTQENLKYAMEEKRDKIPPLAINDEKIKEWIALLDEWAPITCDEYFVTCKECKMEGHYAYQCKYNVDPILAIYNRSDKCNVSIEVLQLVLYYGVDEVLHYMGDAWINDMVLGSAYRKLHPIHHACRDNFHDNALVMTIPERLATSKEMSLL
jgi:hypothetical protein